MRIRIQQYAAAQRLVRTLLNGHTDGCLTRNKHLCNIDITCVGVGAVQRRSVALCLLTHLPTAAERGMSMVTGATWVKALV